MQNQKNNQIYIIGDIHGCYKTLLALIDKLPNKKDSKIVFAGDLIDRGKDSAKVIDLIMENNYKAVRGNHEEMLLEYGPTRTEQEFTQDGKYWIVNNGGRETMKSFKSEEHYFKCYDFIENLPLYLEFKDYKTQDNRYLVVSHSSIGRVWHLRNSQDRFDKEDFENQVLWSRKSSVDIKEIFNVYGHTIFEEPKLTEFSCGIDLGSYHEKDPLKIPNPRICALEFPSMRIFTQENIED